MKRVLLALSLSAGVLSAAEVVVPLHGWQVPAPSAGVHTLSDVSGLLPFVAIAPCRVADTRDGTFPSGYGPPALVANAIRNFTITGRCGIPPLASAVSFNFTVTQTQGPGDLRVFPKGGGAPLVSTLNYVAGQTIANAAIAALNGHDGGLSLQAGVSGTDVIIDVNGYFAARPDAPNQTFVVSVNGDNSAVEALNLSLTCSGPCGIHAATYSESTSGANAISGEATSQTGVHFGVAGYSAGAGPNSVFTGGNSAGVLGFATAMSGNGAGVEGRTISTSTSATGVLGSASDSAANGGTFVNTGASGNIRASLATNASGTNYGLYTGSAIHGSNVTSLLGVLSVAPHPADPSRQIQYVSVASRTSDVTFRGTARLLNGVAHVDVPEDFRLTAREGSYMTTLTPVGETVALAVVREDAGGIVVQGRRDVTFHYVVTAERDLARDHDPVVENVLFTPAALEKGGGLSSLSAPMRKLLVENGTLTPDGTFDRRTADRLGWKFPENQR